MKGAVNLTQPENTSSPGLMLDQSTAAKRRGRPSRSNTETVSPTPADV